MLGKKGIFIFLLVVLLLSFLVTDTVLSQGEASFTQRELMSVTGGDGGDSSDALFDEDVVNTFRLTMAPSDWRAIVERPQDNTWRRADLVWISNVGTATLRDVGVHASGGGTRVPGNPKPSFRIKFNRFTSGQRLRGLSNIRLDAFIKDPSGMRSWLAFAVYRARGVDAPRYAYARLYVNGAYKGLYGVLERVDRDFVKHRFERPVNQLYEAEEDLAWASRAEDPSDPSNYVPYPFIPRMDNLPEDAETVRDLIQVINFNPSEADQVFDVNQFLEFMAVEVIIGESDRFISSYDPPRYTEIITHNCFLYKNGSQFVMIPWDAGGSYARRSSTPITLGFDLRVATRHLILENPENLEAFRTKLRQLLQGFHSTAAVHERIDAMFARVSKHVLEENPDDFEEFVQEIDNLKAYVVARNTSVRQQLENRDSDGQPLSR